MSTKFGNATEKQLQDFKELYNVQAKAIVSKNIEILKKLHSPKFISVGTDGNKYPESEWEESILMENEANNYLQTVYTINKVSIYDDVAVVYVKRRCAGKNNKEKSFNTEIELRDTWKISQDGSWLMQESETITRKLFLNGIEVTPTILRSPNQVMLQGCGDVEH